MRHHVFCVWDFMSLLGSPRRSLTCCEVPWLPTASPESRRLINEIVLDEESDRCPGGRHLSHFELYLEAMDACGADRAPIEAMVEELRRGRTTRDALSHALVPRAAATFVEATLGVAQAGKVHQVAAAFTVGREQIIPAMFRRLVVRLAGRAPRRWALFAYYLKRHVQVDGEKHGKESRRLLQALCGRSRERWREAEIAAERALQARLDLWNAILAGLTERVNGRGSARATGAAGW
jgi:DUF3050 family protein